MNNVKTIYTDSHIFDTQLEAVQSVLKMKQEWAEKWANVTDYTIETTLYHDAFKIAEQFIQVAVQLDDKFKVKGKVYENKQTLMNMATELIAKVTTIGNNYKESYELATRWVEDCKENTKF